MTPEEAGLHRPRPLPAPKGPLAEVPGYALVHQHDEGEACVRGPGGCIYRRTLVGRAVELLHTAFRL